MTDHKPPHAGPGGDPVLTISVVVPCYNEAEVLPEFAARLAAVMDGLGYAWEALFINDGSADQTMACLRRIAADLPQAAILNLSRNFGKEAAMTAGLDHATGDAVVVIDADLQDPPEVIADLRRRMAGGLRRGLRATPRTRRRDAAASAARPACSTA